MTYAYLCLKSIVRTSVRSLFEPLIPNLVFSMFVRLPHPNSNPPPLPKPHKFNNPNLPLTPEPDNARTRKPVLTTFQNKP